MVHSIGIFVLACSGGVLMLALSVCILTLTFRCEKEGDDTEQTIHK
jgi:hypothetical protein